MNHNTPVASARFSIATSSHGVGILLRRPDFYCLNHEENFMPIDTAFAFDHAHAPGETTTALHKSPPELLGMLRDLVGHDPAGKAERTWKGTGFNLIWRPNFGGEFGTKDFFLELNLTDETLAFTEISGKSGIANRGFLQKGIFLGGIAYLQTVNDRFDNTGQHFETGVWANVPETTDPSEGGTVVRMGSIPHGTTINLQGQAFSAPQPKFQTASITPFTIGSPDDGATNLVHFDEENLSIPSTSRTDLTHVSDLTQLQLANPNLLLSQAIADQTITGTTVLVISSDTSASGSVPNAGGGTDNIAFLSGTGTPPAGGPNAVAPFASAIFWIERGKDKAGQPFIQLQYTQRVLLNFHGLSWPHVSVATLRSTHTPA